MPEPIDTRQRLLMAAGELFAQRGVEGVSIREICDRAEANVAAVNYHFGDKQQLYLATVEFAHRGGFNVTPPVIPQDLPPAERLRAFIHGLVHFLFGIERPAWHMQLLLREFADPSEGCRRIVDEFARPMERMMETTLADVVPPETTQLQRRQIALSIIGQCIHYKVHGPMLRILLGDEAYAALTVPQRIAEHVTRFTLAALGLGPTLDRPAAAPATETPRGKKGGRP
jgi:AcrR family transcriptional regulator